MREDAAPTVEAQQQQQQQQRLGGDDAPLIDVTFRSHSAHDAASNPRIPDGVTMVRASDPLAA